MIRILFWASRPVSWVNTAYPFAAAAILTGGLPAWLVVLGVVFFLVPYNLAMYGINDVFDFASDLRNPRKGGVEGSVLADPAVRDAHAVAVMRRDERVARTDPARISREG